MKIAKQLIAFALTIVMGISLAACADKPASQQTPSGGSGGASAQSGTPEKVTFGMVTFNNIPEDVSRIENAVNSYIAETYPEANLEMELKLLGAAEAQQKVNLAMSGGEKLDVFIPLGLTNYISKNQLLPLEDLLPKYGKEMLEILERDAGKGMLAATTVNGHTYSVPVNKGMVLTPTFLYNKDMLDAVNVNIDDINSTADLPALYDKIKEKFPDVFPYAPVNAQWSHILLTVTGENQMDRLTDANTLSGVVIGDSDKVVNLYETEEFKNACLEMRTWYEKGYLPPDSATSTMIATEYISAGRAFSGIASYGGNSIAATMSAQMNKNMGAKHISDFYFDTQAVGVTMAVSSQTTVPEASVKFLNIVYTNEFVLNTLLYGIEGEDFVKPDEHHWAYPEGKNANTVEYTAPLSSGIMGSESLQYQSVGTDYADIAYKSQQNLNAVRSPYFGFMFDGANYTNEISAITNVYNQYMPGLLTGSVDVEKTLADYNKALKDAGLDTLIQAKQTQLDAWIADNKK